ncbi:MAG TPA: Xaa-Pro peptidase family protein, partial [Gemmatimonadaceae bacterium]|nr:Xaa-Pro peptidase family protein [Gemmatimonadaceae bacterium]
MLQPESLPELQAALERAGVDGWLIYDFHGLNPIAVGLLSLPGMTTRRFFVYVPKKGMPVAITHAIEQGPWAGWPSKWRKEKYSSWRTLESLVAELVKGKRVAMEYSPGDAVPYLDRVPAGVIEMVRNAGATVVSSADLVSTFYAVWTDEQRTSHERAARAVATIGQEAIRLAGSRADSASPLTEYSLQTWIKEKFAAGGLETDHGPIVAIGPNAANPHYEPTAEKSATIKRGDILLVDLWAREKAGVFADQTWMGSLGQPSERHKTIWLAVRDARDAAISLLQKRIGGHQPVRGGEVDDAAREVITRRGYGEYFIHRTGHSIDPRDLHGSGPHIDNLETREERELIPGVGFSIEPGVYLPDDVGIRSEVNGFIGADGLLITPSDY